MHAMFLGESTTKECACSSAKVNSKAHQFSSLDAALVVDGAKITQPNDDKPFLFGPREFALEE
jgi:hypothetical protein